MKMVWFGDVNRLSFGTENELWARSMKRAGIDTQFRSRWDPINKGGPADVAFIHTLYTEGALNGLEGAHRRFKIVGGKDVANYTRIGPKARAYLKQGDFDFLALPYIPERFLDGFDGPKIVKWPRGLDMEFTRPLKPEGKRPRLPRVLIWAENGCWERKGHDLHLQILLELQNRGYVFDTIIKTQFVRRALDYFAPLKRKYILQHYAEMKTLVNIYDGCDVLLHLHRGGGQEMVPLEAMARGCVAVLPAAGCSMDYATPNNAVLIPTTTWVPDPAWMEKTTGGADSGTGYEANVHTAIDRMEAVLDDLDAAKKGARERAPRIQERWNVDAVLRKAWKDLQLAFPEIA